jgi:hypothetical protein
MAIRDLRSANAIYEHHDTNLKVNLQWDARKIF